MSQTGKARLIKVDQGYIVRATFDWLAGVTGPAIAIPELFNSPVANNFSNANVDNFDAQQAQSNVALPPIKMVRGVINFNNQPNAYNNGSQLGPLVLIAPDTRDIVVISPKISVNSFANTVVGVPTEYTVSFQLPIYTNGTQLQVIKIADLNPLAGNGMLVLEVLTFDAAPVVW